MILVLFFVVIAKPAFAFDTGDHYDLTRQALQNEGFTDTPIQIVQVENWLVDYFSSSPTSSIEPEVARLHFDNLFTNSNISNYWGWLTVNTRNAVQQAAKDKDQLKVLTILGVSLHAAQDFYSHSNWIEKNPRPSGPYNPVTWFDTTPAAGLYTGYYPNDKKPPGGIEKHGDYTSGLNKDSYVRQPNWDKSYVFAYAASRQWVNAVRTWVNAVNPSFWTTVQNYSISSSDRSALNFDLEAAYRLSEWVAFSGANGHWKGNGSGSATEFTAFAARWTASADSRFVKEFKVRGIHRLLINGLKSDGTNITTPPAVPSVPKIVLNQRAIYLRTLQVAEKDDVGFFESKIDTGGKADFYAKIKVAGQTFVEAMQLDKSNVSPYWTTIKFISSTTSPVPIHYELWDEDGGLAGDDDHCDINPTQGAANLDFNFVVSNHNNTGNITGVHDSPATAVTSQGNKPDKDRAIVKFYVTERLLS